MKAAPEGALLAISPLPLAVAGWIGGGAIPPFSVESITAVLSSAAVAAGGAAIRPLPRVGVLLTAAGAIAGTSLTARSLLGSPGTALAVLLCVSSGLMWLWAACWPAGLRRRGPAWTTLQSRVRGASFVATAFWTAVCFASAGGSSGIVLLALLLSLLVAITYEALWLFREGARHRARAGVLLGVLLAAALGVAFSWPEWWTCLTWVALVPPFGLLSLREPRRSWMMDWWEPILGHPERLLATTFLSLCVAGSIALSLPVCSATNAAIPPVDAAFTAVSAVCVTGLIVLDTPGGFSPVGHIVILVLIQLGGLGIMTFSTAALRLLGRRMSLRQEGAVAGLISPQDRSQLFSTAGRLIYFTLAVEAAGTACLAVPFILEGDSIARGVWRALFTSVSAFCNAGFALQTDSLIPYQTNPWVLQVVALLIIAGGLSPALVLGAARRARGGRQPLSAQAKITLATTGLLLAVGFVFILAVEWNNALAGLSVWDRIHNAWFQSVTPRTAGFNSVDIAAMHPASRSMILAYMFIGGGPGGTAGGVKTTTVALLSLAVIGAVRGRWTVEAFGRRIPRRTVYKAAAISTAGALSVFAALVALELTQEIPADMAFFETVSALGTVGLSTGGTARLDSVGKALIMICMFCGRLGPLTLFMFLTERVHEAVWEHPEEDIDVG